MFVNPVNHSFFFSGAGEGQVYGGLMRINLPLGRPRGQLQSPMLGQGPHSFLKDLASLPNRDFRLRGLNNNFDVNGVPEGEAKGGGGWHNGPLLPPHLRRPGSKWSHWCGCLALCWEPWWSQRWGPGPTWAPASRRGQTDEDQAGLHQTPPLKTLA